MEVRKYRLLVEGPRYLLGTNEAGEPMRYVLMLGAHFYADVDWSLKRDYEEVNISPVTEEHDDWNTIRGMDFEEAKALTGIKARSWADLETKWRAL